MYGYILLLSIHILCLLMIAQILSGQKITELIKGSA